MPASEELPSTLARSPKHAQEVWSAAHDAAVGEYGEGERAHRTAFAALKHQYEKVGDHWEEKEQRGPSDRKAEGGVGTRAQTQEGVDANASKEHLMDIARRLDIAGRSTMKKDELVEAIKRENRRETAARRRSDAASDGASGSEGGR
ncbi:ChaB family protein [Leifsonia sp. F6_8S_P_1B]|uniref:ChaB family protein n=1 Tax=Leifsonia williamsii TaxID=3035919 RepID=A0ABT8K732_9MICO|nr:ChaB family protein [Leifsonia williamsii]MDN4613255.1 ChaB family protein [Leifsonia williamsii]